ncbi:carboxypeptidase regulatory-like domain-containing protein [Sphingomonas sp.]
MIAVAAFLIAALLVASGLLLRRPVARARLAALLALQWAAGAALFLFLYPPPVSIGAGTMTVVTSPIPQLPPGPAFGLPEAGDIAGAQRVPDLAAALRQRPAGATLEIVGDGLTPRDRIAIAAPARFRPPPQPPGIVAISLPEGGAPGAPFALGGQVTGVPRGIVDLLDPAARSVARVRLGDDGVFSLSATAPAPGPALFALVVRDRQGRAIERLAVPVDIREPARPRLLVLAGAPSAEIRQLRRFAEDAGIDATVRVDLGAGLQTGDAPIAIDRASLSRIDLLVIDDRRWERLSAVERGAIATALGGGMGVLLRPTGPLSTETRRGWAALGLPVSGGDATVPVQGDTPDALPLARRDVATPGAIAMLRDASGNTLAAWRPRGRGRVGLWSVTDSFALVLSGAPERYSALWSTLFSTLAREGEAAPPRLTALARAGERAAVCGLSGAATLLDSDRGRRLAVDPASGPANCAAFWPQSEGWHLLRDAIDRQTALYVHPADAAHALAAAEKTRATLALTGTLHTDNEPQTIPGPRWPWLTLLMSLLTMLWWLERRRNENSAPNDP